MVKTHSKKYRPRLREVKSDAMELTEERRRKHMVKWMDMEMW